MYLLTGEDALARILGSSLARLDLGAASLAQESRMGVCQTEQ